MLCLQHNVGFSALLCALTARARQGNWLPHRNRNLQGKSPTSSRQWFCTLAAAHWRNLCLVICSYHLKWVCWSVLICNFEFHALLYCSIKQQYWSYRNVSVNSHLYCNIKQQYWSYRNVSVATLLYCNIKQQYWSYRNVSVTTLLYCNIKQQYWSYRNVSVNSHFYCNIKQQYWSYRNVSVTRLLYCNIKQQYCSWRNVSVTEISSEDMKCEKKRLSTFVYPSQFKLRVRK
jgi:hypothetical protein